MLPCSSLVIALALSGCGGSSPGTIDVAPAGSEAAGELSLETQGDGTTLLRAAERSQVLTGHFAHARLGPAFPPDGRSTAGDRIVLEDTANATPGGLSRFAVVDSSLATAPQLIELVGEFSYDAVSPTLDTLYLISHFSVEHPEQYVVRSFNIATGTLDEPIVADKRASLEGPMSGQPVARVTSEGGRWVYTAYRGGDHGFVHALDAVNKTAICIDFPHEVANVADWQLILDDAATTLTATSAAAKATVRIRTTDFEVSLV
jgi:hypothetical protein